MLWLLVALSRVPLVILFLLACWKLNFWGLESWAVELLRDNLTLFKLLLIHIPYKNGVGIISNYLHIEDHHTVRNKDNLDSRIKTKLQT